MTKRIVDNSRWILLCLVTLMIFFLAGGMRVYAAVGTVSIEMEGYGTQRYPYLVNSAEDLDNIRAAVNSGDTLAGKWFALVDDLDLGGAGFEPLADQTSGKSFQGGFDGRGHTISGFVVDAGTADASFFGKLDGVVENLNLCGTFTGNISATFAQNGCGVIMNCASESEVYGSYAAAGIVDNWNGVLQNVVFQGTVEGPETAGIVNSGNGSAVHVFSKDYHVGSIATIEDGGSFNNGLQEEVADALNGLARQFFLTSEYGAWIHTWDIAGDRLVMSEKIAAFEGTGSENDPYVIDSVDKLEALVLYLNAGNSFDGKYLFQTADINLEGHPWTELSEEAVPFLGVYDGNGYAIRYLDTEGNSGGLFKNLGGKVINLYLADCNTEQGCGFAGSLGDNALILNSCLNGNISDTFSLENLQQTERLVNCYIEGVYEPSVSELNNGLANLVINYGIHCGELYTWTSLEGKPVYGENYKDRYLEPERMYWKGSGVEKNPYQINSIEDLVYLRESVFYTETFWRYWFVQTADIDFSSVHYWRAIADESSQNTFYGNYNGNGYKLLNFHPHDSNSAQSKTIFGNVSGSIFNTHVVNYEVHDGNNGILAHNLTSTGKIFNNLMEISSGASASGAIGVVNNNAGRVVNNIIVCDNPLLDITVMLSSGKENEKQKLPEMTDNRIVVSVSDSLAESFNQAIVPAALHMKQRITNFNALTYADGVLSLKNPLSLKSAAGVRFVGGMLLGNPLLLLAVLWTVGTIVFVLYKVFDFIRKKKNVRLRTWVQLITLLCLYFAFVLAMSRLRPETTGTLPLLCANLVAGGALCLCVYAAIRQAILEHPIEKGFFTLGNIVKQLPLIISLVIPAVVVFTRLDTPAAYDADLYYGSFEQAIQNFQFSFSGLLDSFCIASKPMHGVAILMVIGEALDPGTARGVYICDLILLLVAQVCVYQLIRKVFPKLSTLLAAILGLCFSFSGYVIAGTTYINPDFYSVVTFAIFLWCAVADYKIFAVCLGFLVMCSKPNMIVAYLLFGLVFFAYEVYRKDVRFSRWIVYTLPASIYLILYFGIDSLNRAGIAGNSENEFSVTIGSRMFQYFAYGFIWLQELIVLLAVIKLIRQKRFHPFRSLKGIFLFAVWLSCFSQLLITVAGGATLQLCPRYLSVCAIKNILLFALALDVLSLGKIKTYAVTGILAVLLFVQLFVTIDPVILATTDVKYDGLHYLVFPKINQEGNDLTFYNYEYCKEAWDGSEILSILTGDEIRNLYSDSQTPYKMAIGNSTIYAVYWDTVRNCRTYIPNENCVRLLMKSVVGGLDVREQYWLDRYAFVLRNSDDVAIRTELEEQREKQEVGGFTVYRAKTN